MRSPDNVRAAVGTFWHALLRGERSLGAGLPLVLRYGIFNFYVINGFDGNIPHKLIIKCSACREQGKLLRKHTIPISHMQCTLDHNNLIANNLSASALT